SVHLCETARSRVGSNELRDKVGPATAGRNDGHRRDVKERMACRLGPQAVASAITDYLISFPVFVKGCRLEIGDTADWKSALRELIVRLCWSGRSLLCQR